MRIAARRASLLSAEQLQRPASPANAATIPAKISLHLSHFRAPCPCRLALSASLAPALFAVAFVASRLLQTVSFPPNLTLLLLRNFEDYTIRSLCSTRSSFALTSRQEISSRLFPPQDLQPVVGPNLPAQFARCPDFERSLAACNTPHGWRTGQGDLSTSNPGVQMSRRGLGAIVAAVIGEFKFIPLEALRSTDITISQSDDSIATRNKSCHYRKAPFHAHQSLMIDNPRLFHSIAIILN
jgi:hypothetical protein